MDIKNFLKELSSQLPNLNEFPKMQTHIIIYRGYKKYDLDLKLKFSFLSETDLGQSKESIFWIFIKHAPTRKKITSCKPYSFHD